mmetsp:Transcript_126890/g.219688  ORF Transcript_126890/g.219688 Transcript_126890/m.219688 type:complete len:86 (+) Transcript_126890:421-678(+)
MDDMYNMAVSKTDPEASEASGRVRDKVRDKGLKDWEWIATDQHPGKGFLIIHAQNYSENYSIIMPDSTEKHRVVPSMKPWMLQNT